MFRLTLLLPLAILVGCTGEEKPPGDTGNPDTDDTGTPDTDTADTDTAPDTDTDTDTDSDTDTTAQTRTFVISGTLTNRTTGEPVTSESLVCLNVADPTRALETDDIANLRWVGSGLPGEDGSFTITVTTESTTGLLLQADDCADGDAWVTAATWIPYRNFAELPDAATLNLRGAYAAVNEYFWKLDEQTTLAGYTGEVPSVTGVVSGAVVDVNRDPIVGATVSCGDGCTTTIYYSDTDPTDGRYMTGETLNTTTSINGDFVALANTWSTFEVTADTHTFVPENVGSFPGWVTFAEFRPMGGDGGGGGDDTAR